MAITAEKKEELKKIVEKMNTLENRSDVLRKIEKCETIDQMANMLCDEGVEITPSEIELFFDAMAEKKDNAELDETELENVAGGFAVLCGYCFCCVCVWAACNVSLAYLNRK